MITIYCICDCDGKMYVGSTKNTLEYRLRKHRNHQKYKICSSHLLNLNDCEIVPLARCCDKDRMKTEKHFINTIDCVNNYKLDYITHTKPETSKRYR